MASLDKRIYLYIFTMIHCLWKDQIYRRQKISIKELLRLFLIATGPKRFLQGLENKFVNSNKLAVFYQSAAKGSLNLISNKKMDNICWKTK